MSGARKEYEMKKFSTMGMTMALLVAAGLATAVTAGPAASSSSTSVRSAQSWLDPLNGGPTCKIFCDGDFWSEEPDWAAPVSDVTDCEARCQTVCGVPVCPFLH
jgi:hypothetical protein